MFVLILYSITIKKVCMNLKKIVYALMVLIVAANIMSCGAKKSRTAGTNTETTTAKSTNMVERPAVFVPTLAPAALPDEQKMLYVCEHYWDKFDFSDTTFVSRADTSSMLTSFAVYAVGCVPDSLADKSMKKLMQKASKSKKMFEYFLFLAETVLHDPNSQLRNDEKYIPVLESAIRSEWFDEYERMPYEFDLSIALQNRVGRPANDFSYTLPSGKTRRMYDIKADYTLIFISNPGCPMCREVREQLLSSPLLNELTERGDLKVLVLYPDEDLTAWKEHLTDYPTAWINGYDKGKVITRERSYDLRAIPALYLLDSQKRVMAKDCTDVAYIESLVIESE